MSALTSLAAAVVAAALALVLPSPARAVPSTQGEGAYGSSGWAELVALAHPVEVSATVPGELDPAGTVVLLDPSPSDEAVAELLDFVRGGGRLVATGPATETAALRRAAGVAPGRARSRLFSPAVPAPEIEGVEQVETAGRRAWADAGPALPLVGPGDRALAVRATLDAGSLVLIADPSPLQNRLLDRADNALFAFNLAGDPGAPVVFIDPSAPSSTGEGLAALPDRWLWAFAGLILAGLVLIAARIRRLGPPQPERRELLPPRRAYVDALAASLARSQRREEALDPVIAAARERIGARAGIAPDSAPEDFERAARALGLAPEEAEAVSGGTVGNGRGRALAAGRGLARLMGTNERR